jgi:CO/xanthine dehydrogenase Mo-binding subunit
MTREDKYYIAQTYDAVMLDRKVRFVGDRVAVVAADDPELALRACEAISVDYELLPAVLERLEARLGPEPAKALVEMTPQGELVPHPLDKNVHRAVARAVAEMAIKQGIARAEYVPYVEN